MCRYPESNMKVPAHSLKQGDVICVGSQRFNFITLHIKNASDDDPGEPPCVLVRMKNCKGNYSLPFAMDVMIPIYRKPEEVAK